MIIHIHSDYFITIIALVSAISLTIGAALEWAHKGGHHDTKIELRKERAESERLREIIYDFTSHPSVRPSKLPIKAYTVSRRLSAVKG